MAAHQDRKYRGTRPEVADPYKDAARNPTADSFVICPSRIPSYRQRHRIFSQSEGCSGTCCRAAGPCIRCIAADAHFAEPLDVFFEIFGRIVVVKRDHVGVVDLDLFHRTEFVRRRPIAFPNAARQRLLRICGARPLEDARQEFQNRFTLLFGSA